MEKKFFGQPAGLFTLFFTEMWERFSYYGMRAILILFMTAAMAQENPGLELDTATAGAIYGLYTAAVYILTLPGGWLADNLIGQRKAIWYGGIVIMLGHISLAVPSTTFFFFGLVLVAIGTGLLKGNISTIVGDLYPEGGARRDAGFSIYYMGINIGSFAGQLVVGYLGQEINWHYGFGAAAIGMALGLVMYKLTEHKYLEEVGIQPKAKLAQQESGGKGVNRLGIYLTLFLVALIAVLQLTGQINLSSVVGVAQAMGVIIVSIAVLYFVYVLLAGGLDIIEKRRVIVIFFLFVGAALFWSGFEQAGSTLNLFAERHTERFFGPGNFPPYMPLLAGILSLVVFGYIWFKKIYSDKTLLDSLKVIVGTVVLAGSLVIYWLVKEISVGWEMPASWLQSVNPFFIIILAPVFGALWIKLASKNLNPSAPLKFGVGLILLGLGFVVMMYAARVVVADLDGGVRVSTLWLVTTYFLHTSGELTLSPVGLSMTTKLSPQKFVGQMMGIWFIGAALGNLIAGLFAGNFDESNVGQMPELFWSVVMFSVGSGILFVIFSKPIKNWMGGVE
jgi:POT family proton-dependent oligopeptide transporter